VSADTLKSDHEAIAAAAPGSEKELLIAERTHGKLGAMLRQWGELITSKAGLVSGWMD
jgi:hypothetical protein